MHMFSHVAFIDSKKQEWESATAELCIIPSLDGKRFGDFNGSYSPNEYEFSRIVYEFGFGESRTGWISVQSLLDNGNIKSTEDATKLVSIVRSYALANKKLFEDGKRVMTNGPVSKNDVHAYMMSCVLDLY